MAVHFAWRFLNTSRFNTWAIFKWFGALFLTLYTVITRLCCMSQFVYGRSLVQQSCLFEQPTNKIGRTNA